MNRFLDLFQHRTTPPAGQIYADDRSILFPEVVSRSPRLRLWGKFDAVPATGRFLLIGVATWSGYDMKLLDALEQIPEGLDVIGVFDTTDCKSNEDFEAWIPGIGIVSQTPVVGLWENGKLLACGSGYEGRALAFRACGINAARMKELLDPRPIPA